MSLSADQIRHHLSERLERIATEAARSAIGTAYRTGSLPREATHDLIEDGRQYVAERILRKRTLETMAERYCPPASEDHGEGVARLATGFARNIARHFLRDEVYRHRCRAVGGRISREILDRPAQEDGPETLAVGREIGEQLWLAIEELPEELRTPMCLVFVIGHSHASAGVALGVERERVTYLLEKGIEQLRKTCSAV